MSVNDVLRKRLGSKTVRKGGGPLQSDSGSGAGVSVYLRNNRDDFGESEAIDGFAFDILRDNTWDNNDLDAIPDGLGISFAFDGSSPDFTVTETGAWWTNVKIDLPADATVRGFIGLGGLDVTDGFFGPGVPAFPGAGCQPSYGTVVAIPAGAVFQFFCSFQGATAPGYEVAFPQATITRIA